MRVGVFALATAAFVLYFARYAESRTELVRQARQLNLSSHGHLASTKLGRAVLREAVGDAAIANVTSFLGAILPLSVASALPNESWLAIVVAVMLLAALRTVVAAVIHGQVVYWAISPGIGGIYPCGFRT